jgi:methylmalonyl-CoA mutase cobalamin-binding subunit
LPTGRSDEQGIVVLCTVKGDIHDIGKHIVASMTVIADVDVVDPGVDVAIPTVVQKVRELHPQILGLSGVLTIAFDSMKATLAAVAQAGMRDKVKIMVGGPPRRLAERGPRVRHVRRQAGLRRSRPAVARRDRPPEGGARAHHAGGHSRARRGRAV